MKRSELMENPPAEAVAPYTYLKSAGSNSIRLIDSEGSVWFDWHDDYYTYFADEAESEGYYWSKSAVSKWNVADFVKWEMV